MWPFGKKTKERVESAVKPSYRTECGIDMGDGEVLAVFPILMQQDWERQPTQMCRPMITGVELPGIPWVALVHLIGEDGMLGPQRAYLRAERAEEIGRTVGDFEAEALFNIAARPASWQVTQPGGDAKIAVCSDDYLAAEHCLAPNFINEAGALLGASSLMVGIPCRGNLFATSLEYFASGDEHALVFKMMVEKYYADAGETGISPGLFIFIDGGINSMAEYG